MPKQLDKLLQQLITLHPKYIDLSLNRLLELLQKIDNPHLKLPPIIHIAGTNGKGSTLSYLRHIMMENKFLVHAYISPHLKSFNERIILANKEVVTSKLLKNLQYIKKINNDNPITFFEITTAVAFYLFSKQKADFLILETGLGGRLDATNVVKNSLINIITPIDIDHQEYLGKNIIKITNEKLGIVKKNSNIIIGKQKKIITSYIKEKIKKKISCILIDEVQFLTTEQVKQVCKVSDELNIPAMCYGIRTDFQGKLFEGSSQLLALADNLIELKTVCDCGRKAIMVVRLDEQGKVVKDGDQIKIGGNDSYKVFCRKHFRELTQLI